MIKKIYFKNDTNIDGEEFTINFNPKTNIIIGPKGGGKSTLLNVLVGATNGYISKGVYEAFENESKVPYIPTKVEKFSGEIIKIENLEKKPIKEFENKVNKLSNVIWQKDEIKYKLDNSKEINKDKKNFIEELIKDNQDVKKSIEKLFGIHQEFEKFFAIMDSQINWDNIYKISSKENETDLIIGLKYSNIDEIKKNKKNSSEIKDILEKISFYQSIKDIKDEHFIEGQISKEELEKTKENLISKIEKIIKWMKLKEKQNQKLNRTFWAFENSLKIIRAKIVNESKGDKIVEKFTIDAKFHFEQMAKTIKTIKKFINEFLDENEKITIKMDESKEAGILTLKAKDKVELEHEFIIKLLVGVLYKPNSINNVEDWINAQIKKNSLKDFNRKTIINLFKSYLLEHVYVMANGKKYSSLSNGQKSIFGIKFKLNNAHKLNSQILFLDQPEDDLDNETIKTELVSSINKFYNQKFIITHNANIGLLTGASNKVIVANFEKDKPYSEGNTKINQEKYSAAANFLEGGVDALDKRYKIIIGEKNEN